MKSVTSRLQAHSASSVFKTKKMSASACHPKLSCFLDFMLFTVYIAGFECNGKADRTSMPKSAALSWASKSHLIDLLLVPHTCMSPADIPYEFLISSRAGQPNFLFSSLTSTTKRLNLVPHGMARRKYFHRSTKKSTRFDQHVLLISINKFNKEI